MITTLLLSLIVVGSQNTVRPVDDPLREGGIRLVAAEQVSRCHPPEATPASTRVVEAAQRLVRLALERETAADRARGMKTAVEIIGAESARFLDLSDSRAVCPSVNVVVLGRRVTIERDEDAGADLRTQSPALFLVTTRRGKLVMAAKFDLGESSGRSSDSPRGNHSDVEWKLQILPISETMSMILVERNEREGTGGAIDPGKNVVQTTLYALAGAGFVNVFSAETFNSTVEQDSLWLVEEEKQIRHTTLRDLEAKLNTVETQAPGFWELRLTTTQQEQGDCWSNDSSDSVRCPKEFEIHKTTGDGKPDVATTRAPEVKRYCWGGSSYTQESCRP